MDGGGGGEARVRQPAILDASALVVHGDLLACPACWRLVAMLLVLGRGRLACPRCVHPDEDEAEAEAAQRGEGLPTGKSDADGGGR